MRRWLHAVSTQPASCVAQWDGATWTALGDGMDSAVFTLGTYGNRLIAGGDFSIAGGKVSAFIAAWGPGCAVEVSPDLDHDCDVDADDYSLFENCATGSAIPYTAGCGPADFDTDTGVDQTDFSIFQRCYSGSDVPGDPGCAN